MDSDDELWGVPGGEVEGITYRAETYGDAVAGVIVGMNRPETRFGPCTVLTIEDDRQTHWTVWVSPTDLKNQLATIRPNLGDWIHIEYVGEKDVGKGRAMKLFQVRVNP